MNQWSVRSFRNVAVLVLLICLCFMPRFLNEYLLNILIMTFLWIMLTVSLNFVGTMGYISICHATFYGIGAYVAGILTFKAEAPFVVSLASGALGAGLAGVLLGFPAFRVRGHYFAIATLAFSLILSLVFSNWHEVTGGDRGLTGIFSPFLTSRGYYFLMLGIVVLTVVVSHLVLNSRLGRQLVTIREDEDLAQQMGINTMQVKLVAFGLASLVAGLAGGLMVHYVNFVHPDFFTFGYSFSVIMGMLMGGVGTTGGAVLGGVIAVGLPELLRFTVGWRYIVMGFVLILVMILMPKGIYGTLSHSLSKR